MCGACRAVEWSRLQMVVLVLPTTIYTALMHCLPGSSWVISARVSAQCAPGLRLVHCNLSTGQPSRLPVRNLTVSAWMLESGISARGYRTSQHLHVRDKNHTHSACPFAEFGRAGRFRHGYRARYPRYSRTPGFETSTKRVPRSNCISMVIHATTRCARRLVTSRLSTGRSLTLRQ